MTARRLAKTFAALALLAGFCSGAYAKESTAAQNSTFATRLQDFADRSTEVITHAIDKLGIKYKYGGNSPDTGLDCSGLVRYVFKEAWGKELPRTSAEMSKLGEKIDKNELQPGDLVFYNTLKRKFSHVGIYLGNNQFIHSPSAGGKVRIENIDVSYWSKRFNGARRIDPQEYSNNNQSFISSDLLSTKAEQLLQLN
jgi:cell wall-associated NlpC family hydrolase